MLRTISRPSLRMLGAFLTGVVFLILGGCDDGGSGPPGTLRFGQVGEVSVQMEVPLLFNEREGQLFQSLSWNSTGAWQIRESVVYRTLVGDENLERTQGDPGEYAFLIAQINDSPALKLFDGLVPEVSDPCRPGDTRVSLTIRDQSRDSTAVFVRCAVGSLSNLETAEAGPDPDAVRVIQAAILVRDFTLGRRFVSTFSGTVPFGTLDRTEDSGAPLDSPRAFYSSKPGDLDTPDDWVPYWRAHKGDPTIRPPVVDWANEIVLVAAVGKREEAGDSVEIRRVLQTGEGTQVIQFERIPGNFCSPAARDHYPVHIVVAPRTLLPIVFSEPVTERVDCGF